MEVAPKRGGVQAPPGGFSTINFGNGHGSIPPASPVPATPPAPEPVTPPEQPQQPEPTQDEGPPLASLKLMAIGAIAGAQDTAPTRTALTNLLKELQVAAGPAASSTAATDRGVALPGGAAEPDAVGASLAAMKAALKLRGTHGIISIGKKFRSMDDSGDNQLAYDEFKKALVEMKLGLSEADMTKLFRHFDKDGCGFLSYDELLVGLRGTLSPRREDMVKRAFKVLDKTGDGSATLADLENRYDASKHPDVVAGTKTPRAVLLEFLSTFEAQGGGTKGDGVVTLEEFLAYYSMISASIDEGDSGDDYFELMIRNVWHISGGEGWSANTTCKRVLVVLEDGTQKVVEVTDDFDVDTKDLAAVRAKLESQGITGIKSVALYGDMSGESGPTTSLAAAAPPRSPAPSTPANDPASSPRPSTGRRGNNPDHNRSSIVFG